jgi:hypothetical protein
LRPGLVEYLSVVARSELHTLPDSDRSMSREALGVTKRFMEYHLERELESLVMLDG